jgi:hypothetical protein
MLVSVLSQFSWCKEQNYKLNLQVRLAFLLQDYYKNKKRQSMINDY